MRLRCVTAISLALGTEIHRTTWRHETDEDLRKRIPKNAIFVPDTFADALNERLDVVPSPHADGDQNRNP